MHVSSYGASTGLSALNSQIAARTATNSARTGASTGSFSSTAAAGQHPPPPSGPPPSSDGDSSNSAGFTLQRSTSQFAGMGGAGETPRTPKDFGQLDSDGDGSVSASEYGLDSADKMDQQLFKAIDSDSDGSLSSTELDSFKDTMQSQMAGAQGAGRPHGPPPGPPPDESSNSSTSSSGSVEPAAKTDVSARLQRLAEQYFSPMGGSAQPALSLTA